jgi:ribosomal-protein-alanine N-acetyltransferase
LITHLDIRMAIRADAREIAQLSRHAIEHGLPWSWTPRRVGACIEDRETNVVVATHRAQLLGFGIMSYGEEDAHLQLLAVQIAHRRRGVASALLHWLEDSARVAGIGQVFLESRTSNSGAISFYRRHGYEEVRLLRG